MELSGRGDDQCGEGGWRNEFNELSSAVFGDGPEPGDNRAGRWSGEYEWQRHIVHRLGRGDEAESRGEVLQRGDGAVDRLGAGTSVIGEREHGTVCVLR